MGVGVAKLLPKIHLRVPVDKILEVLIRFEHALGDQVIKVYNDGGCHGNIINLSQPSELGGFLIVCVLQGQHTFHSGHMT